MDANEKQSAALAVEALAVGAFLSWALGSAAVKFIGYSSIWFPLCGFGGMFASFLWWTAQMNKRMKKE